ncbi:hypothetical protein Tco_0547692 [Tanacetum coccineum]
MCQFRYPATYACDSDLTFMLHGNNIFDWFCRGKEMRARYNADIRATNIITSRVPKDIYTLIKSLQLDAKAFGVNCEDAPGRVPQDQTVNETNARGTGAAGNGGAQNGVGKCKNRMGQAKAENGGGVADDYDAFDSDIYRGSYCKTMFMEISHQQFPVYDEAATTMCFAIMTEQVVNASLTAELGDRRNKLNLKVSRKPLCEIVEEARVERPSDRSLASACLYTKQSQEFKVKKVWKPKKVKQVWKATGKLLTNVGYQWKPTRRKFTLGEQCPLTRLTKSKVVLAKQTKNIRTSKIVITEKLSHTSQKPLIRYQRRNKQYKAVPTSISTLTGNQEIDASMRSDVVQIILWYLDSGCSKHMTGNCSRLRNFMQKFIGIVRFGNDHFGAIMGYGDYVIGDSVIFKVYYVEGLGHNLFSVGQFCDSDLEVAFMKHSCYVRDTDNPPRINHGYGIAV